MNLPPIPNSNIAGKEILTSPWKSWFFQLYNFLTTPSFTTVAVNGATVSSGTAAPEGVVTGSPGDLYLQTVTSALLWVKRTGTGKTGWTSL